MSAGSALPTAKEICRKRAMGRRTRIILRKRAGPGIRDLDEAVPFCACGTGHRESGCDAERALPLLPANDSLEVVDRSRVPIQLVPRSQHAEGAPA